MVTRVMGHIAMLYNLLQKTLLELPVTRVPSSVTYH